MTFLSMLGLITIISIFVFYLYVLCNLLDVAKSAWAKLLILITALGTIVSNMKEDLDAGSAMFINVETTNGLLQFVAYNEHNGYYGHEVKLVSKYDDKIIIEADDVL